MDQGMFSSLAQQSQQPERCLLNDSFNRTSSESIKGGSADNGENKKSHSKENMLSKVVRCILDLEQTHDGCSRKYLY